MPNGPMPDAPPDPVAAFERARKEMLRQKRVQTTVFLVVFLACLVAAVIVGQFNLVTLIHGFPRTTEYIELLLPVLRWETLGADVSEWYWNVGGWLDLLVETLLMAFFATLLGTLGAFALSFTASSNLMSTYWIYFVTRRFLEIARSVPDLVYALVFVFAWGLGPLAGILALAIHSMGASGKLFAEVNENIDPNPVEGIRAAGGNWLKTIRYSVVPQVLPAFASYNAVAVRDQRAYRRGARFRRGRRHRLRALYQHPLVLLRGRERDSSDHRRHRHLCRHHLRTDSPSPDRQRVLSMTFRAAALTDADIVRARKLVPRAFARPVREHLRSLDRMDGVRRARRLLPDTVRFLAGADLGRDTRTRPHHRTDVSAEHGRQFRSVPSGHTRDPGHGVSGHADRWHRCLSAQLPGGEEHRSGVDRPLWRPARVRRAEGRRRE